MHTDTLKSRLIELEAGMSILKLSSAIYPPGAWLVPNETPLEATPALVEESWILRSGLSNWAWRAISELNDIKDESMSRPSL